MTDKQYTPLDAQDALKEILGLNSENNKTYSTTTNESVDGETVKQDSITQTPNDILDTSIGLRDGVITAIDPNAEDGFTHTIYFTDTNTSVQTKIVNEYGVTWFPKGDWKNKIFIPSEEIKVSLLAINGTLQWKIIGCESEALDIIPGATIIKRGNSSLIIKDDSISLINNGVALTVNSTWGYINDQRICTNCETKTCVELIQIAEENLANT